jgi:hypothetical protein
MLLDLGLRLLAFVKWQWLPISLIALSLFMFGLGRSLRRPPAKAEDAFAVLDRSDAVLVQAAIDRLGNLDPNKEAYIRLLGYRLDFLVKKFKDSHHASRKLGITALCAGNVSLFVTGSGFFGGATVGLAFCVNSIGVAAGALVIFLNADIDAISNLLLIERLRLELQQFIGSSSEYASMDTLEAYELFAAQVDGLLAENINTQESELKAKAAAKNVEDNED